jgi:hypothetical protein
MLKLKTHSGFHDLFLKYTVQSNNSSCRSVLTPKDLVSPLLIGCLPDEKKMKRDSSHTLWADNTEEIKFNPIRSFKRFRNYI